MKVRGRSIDASIPTSLLAGLFLLTAAGCGDGGGVGSLATQTTPRDFECNVTFSLVDSGQFHEIDFGVDFSGAPGVFHGKGVDVQCDRLVPHTVVIARNHLGDRDPRSELTVSVTHETLGKLFDGPADIARCLFDADEEPVAADLPIDYSETGNSDPVDVAVSAITCHPAGVTTTSVTSSTTTTLVDPCSDVECPEGQECFAGVCDTLDRYEIDLSLADEVLLGALQFDVDVRDAPGVFAFGEGSYARCTRNPDLTGGFESAHRCSYPDHCTEVDGHAEGSIVIAEISLRGMQGPVVVTTCEFQSDGTPPQPSDFAIEVVDASDATRTQVVPAPSVVVSAIRPILP